MRDGREGTAGLGAWRHFEDRRERCLSLRGGQGLCWGGGIWIRDAECSPAHVCLRCLGDASGFEAQETSKGRDETLKWAAPDWMQAPRGRGARKTCAWGPSQSEAQSCVFLQ